MVVLKTIGCGLALLISVNLFAATNSVAQKPVGFFLNNLTDTDDAATASHAKFIRDGKEFDAIEGHEVYAGDVVVTDATGGIQIAFLDSSAVRLHESTEFQIHMPENNQASQLSLSYGHASFAASPANTADPKILFFGGDGISSLINLGVGAHGAVSASTAAKFDIIVTRDANGTTFTSTIAVLKGTATLTPGKANAVTVAFGSQALLTIHNSVAGVGATPVTVTQGNLTKDQITALAKNSVADATVTVNTNGSVTINAVIKNSDGSISLGKVTEVSGHVTKDTWTTKDANNKTIATWSESKTSIVLSRVYDGYTLKSNVSKKTGAGSATFKGPSGAVYKGTTTIDAVSGAITFKSTPAKDGSQAVYSYDPNLGKQTVTIIKKDGTATQTTQSYIKSTGVQTTTTENGTYVNGTFTGDPSTLTSVTKNIGTSPTAGTTPDGHTLDQNQPPVTQ